MGLAPSSWPWRIIATNLIALLVALGLGWALVPHPASALGMFSPIPLLTGCLAALAAVLGMPLWRRVLPAIMAVPNRWFDLSVFIITAVFSGIVMFCVFDAVPHVSDSIAYYFMAKIFAAGHLSLPEHPWPEFVTYHFFISDGQMFGIFPPGWPMVLASGMLLGAPWLVTPLLSGGVAVVTLRLGRRLLGEAPARLVPVIFLFSPFFLFQSSEFMAHTLAALLACGGVLLMVRAWQEKHLSVWLSALLGFCAGWLLMTRPLEGIIAGVALLVFGGATLGTRRLTLRQLVPAALVSFGLLLCLLAYNHHLTGSAWLFPQDLFFIKTDPSPKCHSLGFGEHIGCITEHGADIYDDGYNLTNAWTTTRRRLASLYTHFMGWPLLILLTVFSLFLARRRRIVLGLWLWFMLWTGAYALFYYHGNCYGPRMLYAAFPPLVLLSAVVLTDLGAGLASQKKPSQFRRLRWYVALVLLGIMCGTAAMVSIPSLGKMYKRFRNIDPRLQEAVEEADVHNVVIFVPGTDVDYGLGFMFNTPDFDSDVVYAQSWGDQDYLFARYMGRRGLRARPFDNYLYPIEKGEPGVIRVEGESRIHGMRWADHSSKPFPVFIKDAGIEDADDNHLLYYPGGSPGDWFSFRMHVFDTGRYDLMLRVLESSYCSPFELLIDGTPVGRFDPRGADEGRLVETVFKDIAIDAGMHTFRFNTTEESFIDGEYGVGIDIMELRPRRLDAKSPR